MAYDEDEQAARFKQWWVENWKPLAAGLVMGLGAIVGWNQWQASGEQRYQRAATTYAQLANALDSGAANEAAEHYRVLTENYRRTPYAATAALRLAGVRVQDGDLDAAGELLQWAVDNARDDGVVTLARLRLARIHLAQGDLAAAEAVLPPGTGTFAALVEEVRGDLHLARGERTAAYAAYERALAQADDLQRDTLRYKLDDLADAAEDI